MLRRSPWLAALALSVAACRHDPPLVRPHRLPPPGERLLVLAPHPDDEVLGAAGIVEAAVRRGARVTVVVATDGEAGRNESGDARDLAQARRAETRRALGRIGIAADAVHFLGYADGGLASAWNERWLVSRRTDADAPSEALVNDLRAAIVAAAPTTVVMPMALDHHTDHRALNRFGLLALLAERERSGTREVLGYLIHGGAGWPERPPPDPCTPALFPWTRFPLNASAVEEKAALIYEYRTQVGSGSRLLRFARRDEPFTMGEIVSADRAMGATHPGLRRTADGVVVRVPRTRCVLGPDAGARIRLRFFGSSGVEERVVAFQPSVAVTGGNPGQPLGPARDLRVRTTGGAIRLALAESFLDRGGAVLEILPGVPRRPAPAWLLTW